MSDIAILGIVIGAALGYAFIAGLVWQTVRHLETDEPAEVAAIFWLFAIPVVLVVWIFRTAAFTAPEWIADRIRHRRDRVKLPLAKVRKP